MSLSNKKNEQHFSSKKNPKSERHYHLEDHFDNKYLKGSLNSNIKFSFANIQAKLKVSQPSDPYEQEADKVADQVMRTATYDGGAPIRKPSSDSKMEANDKVTNEINNVRSSTSGSPLDSSTKQFMESRFGYDFSNVRIHKGEMAARSAESINALAYTVNDNIVFGRGRFAPETYEGRQLIAHELAHVVQQRSGVVKSGVLIQRAPLKDELEMELKKWAEEERKSIDLNDQNYASNLQDFAWKLITSSNEPIPKPKNKKDLHIWQKKFQKARLLVEMILKGGKDVLQKEARAGLIINMIAQAGISKEAVSLARQLSDASEIETVYKSIIERVQSADPESLGSITEFFIKEKGKTDNPVIEKMTDKSGSFERTLSDAQLNAILKPLIRAFENDAEIIDLLSEVLIHKPSYRKTFSIWMWKEGKERLLFRILESKYFIEPGYGPTVFSDVGQLELEKDMPWVYSNKQKYYVNYLVQLGGDTGVDIPTPKDLKFTTLRKWLDDHTERIGQALAKKFSTDPDRWIEVYEQITDIFTYHVSGRDIIPDPRGKLAKLSPGAPNKMRLKVDCDVLATYAMRYFFGIQDPNNRKLIGFEPVGYLSIMPPVRDGHAVALMRRDGRYYVISNKKVFPTSVVGDAKNPKKEVRVREMIRIALESAYGDPKPDKYKVYYADALVGGAMSSSFSNSEESVRRQDLEP